MPDIPDNVMTFLKEHIDSAEQVEMLRFLRNNADKEWTAQEISRSLSTQRDSAAHRLAQFHSLGILVMKPAQDGPIYQYRPKTQGLDATIAELAEAYSRYPVRVINLIYSKPIDKIRTFADAFKLRKEDQ